MTRCSFEICDLHTHTTFSDGRMTPEQVLQAAREKGYRVGIADHCGRGSFQIASNREFDRYQEALRPLPVFRAVELDLGNPGGVTADRLAGCDYLIAGVHSLADHGPGERLDFFDPESGIGDPHRVVRGMLQAIENGAREYRFDILAHPGLLPMALRDDGEAVLDGGWEERLISLAFEHGFALEISSRWRLPGRRLIEKARRAGVRFSLGSDGHGPDRVCRLDYSLEMAAECGLARDDLIWPRSKTTGMPSLSQATAPTGSARSAP